MTTLNPGIPANSTAAVVNAEGTVGQAVLPTEYALVNPIGATTTQPASQALLSPLLSHPDTGVNLTAGSPIIGIDSGFAGQFATQTVGSLPLSTLSGGVLPLHLPALSLFPTGLHF